jgi:hypothetical protein
MRSSTIAGFYTNLRMSVQTLFTQLVNSTRHTHVITEGYLEEAFGTPFALTTMKYFHVAESPYVVIAQNQS